MSDFVSYHARIHKSSHIALAGSVFANVKLNQRILNLPEVKHLFILPHMGDGGLGYGAALYPSYSANPAQFSLGKIQNGRLDDLVSPTQSALMWNYR